MDPDLSPMSRSSQLLPFEATFFARDAEEAKAADHAGTLRMYEEGKGDAEVHERTMAALAYFSENSRHRTSLFMQRYILTVVPRLLYIACNHNEDILHVRPCLRILWNCSALAEYKLQLIRMGVVTKMKTLASQTKRMVVLEHCVFIICNLCECEFDDGTRNILQSFLLDDSLLDFIDMVTSTLIDDSVLFAAPVFAVADELKLQIEAWLKKETCIPLIGCIAIANISVNPKFDVSSPRGRVLMSRLEVQMRSQPGLDINERINERAITMVTMMPFLGVLKRSQSKGAVTFALHCINMFLSADKAAHNSGSPVQLYVPLLHRDAIMTSSSFEPFWPRTRSELMQIESSERYGAVPDLLLQYFGKWTTIKRSAMADEFRELMLDAMAFEVVARSMTSISVETSSSMRSSVPATWSSTAPEFAANVASLIPFPPHFLSSMQQHDFVRIQVMGYPDVFSIAHKTIICARSRVIKTQLSSVWARGGAGIMLLLVVPIPCSLAALRLVVEFMYTDGAALTDDTVDDVLMLSDLWLMSDLRDLCEAFYAEVLRAWPRPFLLAVQEHPGPCGNCGKDKDASFVYHSGVPPTAVYTLERSTSQPHGSSSGGNNLTEFPGLSSLRKQPSYSAPSSWMRVKANGNVRATLAYLANLACTLRLPMLSADLARYLIEEFGFLIIDALGDTVAAQCDFGNNVDDGKIDEKGDVKDMQGNDENVGQEQDDDDDDDDEDNDDDDDDEDNDDDDEDDNSNRANGTRGGQSRRKRPRVRSLSHNASFTSSSSSFSSTSPATILSTSLPLQLPASTLPQSSSSYSFSSSSLEWTRSVCCCLPQPLPRDRSPWEGPSVASVVELLPSSLLKLVEAGLPKDNEADGVNVGAGQTNTSEHIPMERTSHGYGSNTIRSIRGYVRSVLTDRGQRA